MAVLAPQDWHLPSSREHTMDISTPASSSSANSNSSPSLSTPRQRSSPSNDSNSQPRTQLQQQQQSQPQLQTQQPQQQQQLLQQQQQHQQQQQQLSQPSYPYPVQQPQGSWTPSIAAQPFYPSFYQNPLQQQQYPLHAPQPAVAQPSPYFDPANAQLAQWAYQQMMFNAQAHQLQHMTPLAPVPRTGPPAVGEYFPQNSIPSPFNSFPSGTPPPHPNHHSNTFVASAQGGQRGGIPDAGGPQYNGFHPYRRPPRNPARPVPPADPDRRSPGHQALPQPPYGRPEASGSSTSVNSSTSHSGGPPRSRTNSNQSVHSTTGHPSPSISANNAGSVRSRTTTSPPLSPGSPSGSSRSGAPSSPATGPPTSSSASTARHHRNQSSTSSSSSSTSSRPAVSIPSTTTAAATGMPTPRPARPSPLSQGNFTAAEKRMSRDDSDLPAMREQMPSASMLRSGGLKGRLRRALAFNNAAQALQETEQRERESGDEQPARSNVYKPSPASPGAVASGSASTLPVPSISPTMEEAADGEPAALPAMKKKSRASSLFNSRMNMSTDNISLSSTVSSASVMIRKLGSMGKLARRNSLAGITSLFNKDKKDKDEDGTEAGGSGSKKGKKKSGKAEVFEASVSHVTAELDRSSSGGDWSVGDQMSGLSPAAKLARQHTLKSNAEAAARAKAQQEAAANASKQTNGAPVPTWERNTTTRRGSESPVKQGGIRVSEDGTRVLLEDDDSGSDGSVGHYGQEESAHSLGHGPERDEDDWDEEDEDVTIRLSLERTSIHDGEVVEEETEAWIVETRRSMEKVRRPAKGILKHAGTYDQHSYLTDLNSAFTRARSNSYNSSGQSSELGPLARIPSPDPDHIDGLHRHPSHSSNHSHSHYSHSHYSSVPSLPPLSFDSSVTLDSPTESTPDRDNNPLQPHPPTGKSLFSHSNSSAPALSTMVSTPNAHPTLTHRSATAPAKRLAFASNLSVYDTFSASMYDRRSEPATWSRLTPALAQRIKEELNSYKMEEMEVHAASRIHTQFFV